MEREGERGERERDRERELESERARERERTIAAWRCVAACPYTCIAVRPLIHVHQYT